MSLMVSPKKKRKRLSLKLGGKSRFDHKMEEEIESITKGYIPQNRDKNTRWARKCFCE